MSNRWPSGDQPRKGAMLVWVQVVAGYFAYRAVPTNSRAVAAFRYHIVTLWYRQLRRRSQKGAAGIVEHVKTVPLFNL